MRNKLGHLNELPRTALLFPPTPIEPLRNLSNQIGGGVQLYSKRDDISGLAFGGNKVRQLEFYMGEAQVEQADTILITGAVQSNFCRLAAAAARKLGMDCHIQLEERVAKDDFLYRASGNVLIDKLLGATLHSCPEGEDEAGADRRLEEIADMLRGQGRRPYIVHLAPGHKPLGALGYVVAGEEIIQQTKQYGFEFDEIVVASGSGNTHAGLLFGLRALGHRARVTGVCVRRGTDKQRPRIAARCEEIALLLGIANPVSSDDICLTDVFLAPGYGELNESTLRAIEMAAQLEALITDPVYTGKTMAEFIERAKESAGKERSMIFLHTGGTPAIFAYGGALDAAFDRH